MTRVFGEFGFGEMGHNYCRAFRPTLTVLLHYLWNLKNHNCCRFQWRKNITVTACETSEFILLDMRPP